MRSRKLCCCGKTVSITYSECLCVCSLNFQACKTIALHFVIRGLSGSTTFSILSHKQHDFWKELFNINVFGFSLQVSSETFLILQIQQDIINVPRSSCTVPIILERL